MPLSIQADRMSIASPQSHRPSSRNGYSALQQDPPSSYEEFFGGVVSCPSCQGTGRIPRAQENALVALIPMNDRRLKPRRTTLYVILTISLCALFGGLLLFFFFPRSVQISTNVNNIKPTYMYINVTTETVEMTIRSQYNFSNANFFPVTVDTLALTIFFDQKIVSQTTNATSVRLPMRSHHAHYVTNNITFEGDEGYIAYYCNDQKRWGHTLTMSFQATSSTSWWGRSEETSVQTYEHVRCSPSDVRL